MARIKKIQSDDFSTKENSRSEAQILEVAKAQNQLQHQEHGNAFEKTQVNTTIRVEDAMANLQEQNVFTIQELQRIAVHDIQNKYNE